MAHLVAKIVKNLYYYQYIWAFLDLSKTYHACASHKTFKDCLWENHNAVEKNWMAKSRKRL